MNLIWNVILYENGTVRSYNIFNNIFFYEEVEKLFNNSELNFEEFSETIKREARWQFWSRCEYEMILSEWPNGSKDRDYKIDVFEQLEINWDRFIEYLWNSYCFGDDTDNI